MTPPAPALRVAVWQARPLPLDVAANLLRIEAQAAAARDEGADLLVCPEMVLSGYAIGAEAARRLAEAADGPSARHLAAVSRRSGLAIAYGYPERGDDGRIHNAAQIVAGGRSIGRCRKAQLYGEMDRRMFAPGRGDEPLATLHGWRLGLAICYDIEFPETARRLATAGADLIVVPTANMAEFDVVQDLLVPARALENTVFVAYANLCGEEPGLHYGGLSCIAPPDGRAPVRAGRDEALVVTTLERERLAEARARFTYLQDRFGG